MSRIKEILTRRKKTENVNAKDLHSFQHLIGKHHKVEQYAIFKKQS